MIIDVKIVLKEIRNSSFMQFLHLIAKKSALYLAYCDAILFNVN